MFRRENLRRMGITKYVKVDWPEYQSFMELPNFKEDCYLLAEENSYMIPEELYNEVMYKLQFPKTYENTNLGTIVCYETRAVINGEDTYWYDLDLIKRGSDVLLYNHDIDNYPKWIIAKCVACSMGFPILFEDNKLLPGINCEIIGVKDV